MADVTTRPQRILDCHVHWWDLEANYYPWLTDRKPDEGGMSGVDAIARTYLPAHYFKDAAGYDIAGFVHVQAEWDPSDPLGETTWLERIARDGELGERPFGIVAFADLSSPDVEPLLEAQAAHSRVRGVRQMLNFLPDNPTLCWVKQDYLANPVWLGNFHLLAKYGLGFDAMCFAEQMRDLARLAAQHPDIPFYLEHAGMPHDHSDTGRSFWRSGMAELAARDNVVAKVSGLGNTIPRWSEDLVRPYVEQTIELFGPRRVMFASNFPTDSQFSDMSTIWGAFLSITSGCSADERDDMFFANAKRQYKI